MPIFDFKCNVCENEFEELKRNDKIIKCPECGDVDVTRLFSSPAVQTKFNLDKKKAVSIRKKRKHIPGTKRIAL